MSGQKLTLHVGECCDGGMKGLWYLALRGQCSIPEEMTQVNTNGGGELWQTVPALWRSNEGLGLWAMWERGRPGTMLWVGQNNMCWCTENLI